LKTKKLKIKKLYNRLVSCVIVLLLLTGLSLFFCYGFNKQILNSYNKHMNPSGLTRGVTQGLTR